jgi:competence ComEA-like helix-hairpin-helix protein
MYLASVTKTLDIDRGRDRSLNDAARCSSVRCTIHREVTMVQLIAFAVLLAAVAVPSPAAADTASGSVVVGATRAEKVNINTADVKALMTLSGVNRGLAEKIVKYRDEHGTFKKAQDLRKVDGVGDALWEKNRERIVVK